MVNFQNPSSNPLHFSHLTGHRAVCGFGFALVFLCCSLLLACGPESSSPVVSAGASAASGDTQPANASLSLIAQVGKKLFFDKSLSASGAMSCASCHDPDRAYGPPNALAVQLGGSSLDKAGMRAVPSLRYKLVVPVYSNELVDPDGAGAPAPGGGFGWDGRADTLAAQAGMPLLSRFEMANATPEAVVSKVQAASYAPLFLQAFGKLALADGAKAFANISEALQAFQKEDPSFRPYSSKFDLYNQLGHGNLSAAELRGKAVFNDTNRGNCAACHIPDLNQFTDHMYAAIGVPRNSTIPMNAVSDFNDMGLCGPLRVDLQPLSKGAPNQFCGMFKTPTLRNVATRSVFFHNGVITSLDQAIQFYNTRDTHPEIWYPTVGGSALKTASTNFPTYGLITTQYQGGKVQKFNDLPAVYIANIDAQMPLDGRTVTSNPPMKEQEIVDLICFLKTLTDGFDVLAKPSVSGACVN